MFQKGIIDLSKVMRAALQAVADLLSATEVMVAEMPKKALTASQGRHGSLKLDCTSVAKRRGDNSRLYRSRAMRLYRLAYSRGHRGVRRLRCVQWRFVNHA